MTGLMGLLDKPAGVDWPEEEFAALKKEVNDAGLKIEVIESVNVHEDIKLGVPSREEYILRLSHVHHTDAHLFSDRVLRHRGTHGFLGLHGFRADDDGGVGAVRLSLPASGAQECARVALWHPRCDRLRVRALAVPKTVFTVFLFIVILGLTGDATVTPTSEIVSRRFGPESLGFLFGITFVGHQIGGFISFWLGGVFISQSGNYQAIWMFDIALCALASAASYGIQREVTRLN